MLVRWRYKALFGVLTTRQIRSEGDTGIGGVAHWTTRVAKAVALAPLLWGGHLRSNSTAQTPLLHAFSFRRAGLFRHPSDHRPSSPGQQGGRPSHGKAFSLGVRGTPTGRPPGSSPREPRAYARDYRPGARGISPPGGSDSSGVAGSRPLLWNCSSGHAAHSGGLRAPAPAG